MRRRGRGAGDRPARRPAVVARRRIALWVDRPLAAHAAWYELFPRSFGGLQGAAEHLPYVADLGFDVVYLPPIHPIGTTHRKGRDNTPRRRAGRPGQPVGHRLGRRRPRRRPPRPRHDRRPRRLRRAAAASSASRSPSTTRSSAAPTTPGCASTPSGSPQRPDGSIRYAENPPKKYQDIHPIDFWPADEADRVALWNACRDVLEHWIGHGIRTFRVDNPHTKPLAFWEWVIDDVHARHPDVRVPRRGLHRSPR